MKGSVIPLTLASLPLATLAAMQMDDRPATELVSCVPLQWWLLPENRKLF